MTVMSSQHIVSNISHLLFSSLTLFHLILLLTAFMCQYQDIFAPSLYFQFSMPFCQALVFHITYNHIQLVFQKSILRAQLLIGNFNPHLISQLQIYLNFFFFFLIFIYNSFSSLFPYFLPSVTFRTITSYSCLIQQSCYWLFTLQKRLRDQKAYVHKDVP